MTHECDGRTDILVANAALNYVATYEVKNVVGLLPLVRSISHVALKHCSGMVFTVRTTPGQAAPERSVGPLQGFTAGSENAD